MPANNLCPGLLAPAGTLGARCLALPRLPRLPTAGRSSRGLRVPAGNLSFAPGACERLEPFLASRIVGQELALSQIGDAICDHLAAPEPPRPLVLSLHGPPGVGKSMFHQLAAQALYNRHIRGDLRCPGLDCAGYKVGGRVCSGGIGAKN